ncbi:ABC-2 type transport system ATP-binding protein [Hydrobacter penzbergensis]|uniref:ABC-2 type transport system ATP-binding protein n=1 Tax=Hydrobacter penzbergensis TaxID=1235997 RepID=A0A8X8IHG1_9BACT|nr:ABC transporter ATP-binding protein [Hydrobacter penzbergensis]SDX00052.1 ABC-2 type transport system ATP-binding protein [Hydrobacter penzbergensis]
MLEILNIKKGFHSELLLNIPYIKLEGGVYWLEGVNGSGKTTLFKMIAGLLPFEGDVKIDGISLKKQPVTYRQRISLAETEPLFPRFLTGIELIHFYYSVRKVQPKEVNPLLELYAMNSFINDTVGTYSAGMIKKLSLVLALIGNPSWIILDEPFITLDAVSCRLTLSLFAERCQNFNTNFFISSHQDLHSAAYDPGTRLCIRDQNLAFE